MVAQDELGSKCEQIAHYWFCHAMAQFQSCLHLIRCVENLSYFINYINMTSKTYSNVEYYYFSYQILVLSLVKGTSRANQ